MRAKRDTKEILESILKLATGQTGNIKIYDCVATSGIKHQAIDKTELGLKLNHLKSIPSPFQTLLDKNISLDNKDSIVLHEKIINSLKSHGEAVASELEMKRLLNGDGILKGFKSAVLMALNNSSFSLDDTQVLKMTKKAKTIVNKELLATHLILNDHQMLGSAIVVLAKGINNIERPKATSQFPLELVKQVGVIQIGMALNKMAKSTEPYFAKMNRDDSSKVVDLSKFAISKIEFLNYAQKLSNRWTSKNKEKLSKFVLLQRESQIAENKKNMNLPTKSSNPTSKRNGIRPSL